MLERKTSDLCPLRQTRFTTSPSMQQGFAREVLKWLQSLDLGIPIKHPKRDFANGYLIAVIFSRYYPGELRPWSLYTGDSENLKANNWQVLEKCISI